jgi:CheY-specific phosphatase CheX
MSDHKLESLLAPAVNDVLETMFFSEAFGSSEHEPGVAELEAHVAFLGETSGNVGVRISEPSARCLAASFLGESENSLSDTQIAQVVCELTNMLCGCIVSKMASRGCFALESPQLSPSQSQQLADVSAIEQTFAIEHGTLTVSLCTSPFA